MDMMLEFPYEDKKEHDADIYNFLSYDFFRPEEFDYGQRNNETLYPDGVRWNVHT